LIHDGQSQRFAVCLGSVVIDSWAESDGVGRRLALARLVNSGLATATEVAQLFGVHRNTVGRIAKQVEAGGTRAVLPRKPGPKRRHKVTAKVLQVLQQAVESGWSSYEAAREVRRRTGVELSHGHVWGLLHQLRQERPETLPMDLEDAATNEPPVEEEEALSGEVVPAPEQPGEEPEFETPVPEGAPVNPLRHLPPGEAVRSRYLGLTLFYVAVEVTGLLALAEQVYQLTGPVRFGVRQVFWQLFCLALLQEPTIERVKHLLRADLGAVIGCGRAACVKTLRRKLAVLSGQGQAVTLGLRLARHWLDVGLLNASYLYVDGHMKVYSGKRLVREVWNSQRRMPLPGIEQYFVNDLRGRPLLVVSQDVSGNLAKSFPQVVAAIRQVLGERHFTVIFDRGGYDGKLFASLVEQQIDFITYQRGEVALPVNQFRRREVRWRGKRVRLWLAEDTVDVGDSGPWRRIVLRTADGHQTPILTSLKAEAVAAARVTALMLARWRQENFFKYARSHLGLDVLTSYATDPVPDRQVPNPEVKAAKNEVGRLRTMAGKVRAALGQTVVLEAQQVSAPEDGTPPTTAAAKRVKRRTAATRETLLAQLQAIDAELAQVQARLTGLPQQVALHSLGQPQETPQLEPKLIADAVKLAAYNAQSWLADRLVQRYPHPGDLHDLLRAFAQLSGAITRQPNGTVHICLDPPDLPLYRSALEGLCQDLNLLHPHFPGTDIPVTYAVSTHHFGAVV
jgi:transposase